MEYEKKMGNNSHKDLFITCNKQEGIWIKPCKRRSTFSNVPWGMGVITYSRPLDVSMPLTIPVP